MNDFDSTDDDSSLEDDSDKEGQGSRQNQRQIGSQFNSTGTHAQYNSYDAIPPHWVIPGADQYFINSPSTEAATSNVGAFYKGQIFHTKKNLKDEFGKYSLREKFNPITKRSTQYRFEVGCKDVNCDFSLKAIRRQSSTYWQVKKFVPAHTCSLDTYESHFRKVSSVVIGEMFASKLTTNGRIISPIDIIVEMRDKHGIQVTYTKTWQALEHT